jgi:hypothetical protein
MSVSWSHRASRITGACTSPSRFWRFSQLRLSDERDSPFKEFGRFYVCYVENWRNSGVRFWQGSLRYT